MEEPVHKMVALSEEQREQIRSILQSALPESMQSETSSSARAAGEIIYLDPPGYCFAFVYPP